jgi:hypothetical protein
MGREEGGEIKEVRNEIKQRRVGIAAQTTRREPQTAQYGEQPGYVESYDMREFCHGDKMKKKIEVYDADPTKVQFFKLNQSPKSWKSVSNRPPKC